MGASAIQSRCCLLSWIERDHSGATLSHYYFQQGTAGKRRSAEGLPISTACDS